MAEDKKETELIRLDALTLWGEKGNISVSIKNGYSLEEKKVSSYQLQWILKHLV